MNFYTDLEQYHERIAIITEDGERLSYQQFLEEGDQLMTDLPERKVLFLVCRNCLESVCAYIAALRKGIVPVMINSGIDASLFQHLYEAYHPSYIFAPQEWKILENLTLQEMDKYRSFVMCQTSWKESYEIHPDLALLLTTSGSTGSPKLVRQSYKNIVSNANSIAEYLEIQPEDCAITTMPMSYTYCLSIINSHLLRGATVIMNDYSIVQKEFWTLMKEEKPTTFGGVPFIYEQLKTLRFARMNLPTLKYLTQAGGKLSKEMAEEFYTICKEKNMKFIVMYGQTEATARMSYLPWEYAKEKAGSIGIAIPGGEFSLIDAEDKEIKEADVTGELVYRGDNVTLGYAESDRDLAKGDERHGILYTGDMAKRDKDGFYYIVGRKKRFLKLFGNRVNLDEVEMILKKQGYSCVCAGVDDKLSIYTTDQDVAIHEEMKKYIGLVLGLHVKGFEVKYIEEIPRNDSGKVAYSMLDSI